MSTRICLSSNSLIYSTLIAVKILQILLIHNKSWNQKKEKSNIVNIHVCNLFHQKKISYSIFEWKEKKISQNYWSIDENIFLSCSNAHKSFVREWIVLSAWTPAFLGLTCWCCSIFHPSVRIAIFLNSTHCWKMSEKLACPTTFATLRFFLMRMM